MVIPRIESSISRSQNLELGTCIMKPTVFLVCFVGIAGSVIRQILSAKKHGASSRSLQDLWVPLICQLTLMAMEK